MSKENSTRVHYKGKSAVEIRVGNHQRTFQPDEVAEIEDPRFRIDLLDNDDFELTNADERPGEKPARKANAKAKQRAAGSQKAEAEPEPEETTETTETGGVNDNE